MKKRLFYRKAYALREKILSHMVGFLNPIYKTVMPKNRAWRLDKEQLRLFPQGTLGKDLSIFMEKNNFDMLPYLETHDIYHVLLGYQPKIVDESRLYFFLLGNGKYSLEVIGTVWVSLFLLPDYWGDLFQHYRKGKDCRKMGHWDFRYLMHENTDILRGIIFNRAEAKFYV